MVLLSILWTVFWPHNNDQKTIKNYCVTICTERLRLPFSPGIPIVKLEDRQLARSLGVFAHPSVVIFRSFGSEAVIYSGDLKSGEAVLEWLLVQMDPANEAIEDVHGRQLRRTIEREKAVAVFVCKCKLTVPKVQSRKTSFIFNLQ